MKKPATAKIYILFIKNSILETSVFCPEGQNAPNCKSHKENEADFIFT